MKTIKFTLFTIFILVIVPVFGQDNCDYMFDAQLINNEFIIANEIKGINGNPDIPVIVKTDLNGQEIWRIEDSIDTGYINLSRIELFSFTNNEMYALLTILDSHQNSPLNKEIWKIDIQNGTILWKSSIFVSDQDAKANLIDYNSDEILFYNPLRNNNGGDINGFEVYKFQKNDGTITYTFSSNYPQKNIQIVKDTKGNLIYTYYHPTLHTLSFRKINLTDFKSVIWQKNFRNNPNAKIEIIEKMLINAKDELYLFGHNTAYDTDLIVVNSNTGEQLWSLNNIRNDHFISDYKFTPNTLYLSYKHQFVGAVTTSFNIQKIDLNSHSILWNSQLSMNVTGNPTNNTGNNQAIFSFDLDCNNMIYATGYYASQNYVPGAFGVMKINAQDGSKVNDLTITLDANNVDEYSIGLKTFIANGNPYFLGNLQYSNIASTRVIVKTDTNLNQVISTNNHCSVLGVLNDKFETSISISPNPVKDDILKIETSESILRIDLLSLNGKLLISKTTNLNQLHLTDLQSGIYLLRLKTANRIHYKKIIVE